MRHVLKAAAAAALAFAIAGPLATAAAPPHYTIVHRFAGPDGFWDYTSFDPALDRVFVAHGDAIMAIDVGSGTVTPHLADAARSHAVLPIPGTDLLLTTNSGAGDPIGSPACAACESSMPPSKPSARASGPSHPASAASIASIRAIVRPFCLSPNS